jgi:hypothetical protein
MPTEPETSGEQTHLHDDCFYFSLRLRKDRIHQALADINARFPGESAAQRARRLLDDQNQFFIVAGVLLFRD